MVTCSSIGKVDHLFKKDLSFVDFKVSIYTGTSCRSYTIDNCTYLLEIMETNVNLPKYMKLATVCEIGTA